MRHEVVDHVSTRMHVPTSLINRLREGKAGTLERLRADHASLAVYMTEEVLDVAARGNVVLRGWGATCLLRAVPHVVCVRVTRPFAQRVAWLQRAASATTTSPSSKRRSGAAIAPTRRACTRSSASPGAIRCSTTSSSTPTASRSRAAPCRSPRWRSAPNSPRPTRRARCCRTWRSRRAFAPRCAPTRRRATVDVTVASDAGRVVLSGMVARRRRDAGGRARRRAPSPASRRSTTS